MSLVRLLLVTFVAVLTLNPGAARPQGTFGVQGGPMSAPSASLESVPAAVSAPVQGTDLTAVWNLQFGGAGSRSSANGAYTTWAADTYLHSRGVTLDNYHNLWLNLGRDGKGSISKFDCTNCPSFRVNGSGTASATFTDVTFGPGSSLITPSDVNKNINSDGTSAVAVTCNYCTFNVATFTLGTGSLQFNHSRFTGQVQNLGDVVYGGTGPASLGFDYAYITGCGVNAPNNAHIECTQFLRSGSNTWTFRLTHSLVDIGREGQKTSASNAAWTTMWSTGSAANTFDSDIIIGLGQVNADSNSAVKPLGHVVHSVFGYNNNTPKSSIANSVLESGWAGYTVNGSNSPTSFIVDGGGNRSLKNLPLGAGQLK